MHHSLTARGSSPGQRKKGRGELRIGQWLRGAVCLGGPWGLELMVEEVHHLMVDRREEKEQKD